MKVRVTHLTSTGFRLALIEPGIVKPETFDPMLLSSIPDGVMVTEVESDDELELSELDMDVVVDLRAALARLRRLSGK